MTSNLRIAVDIGGTFTDAVLVGGEKTVLVTAKPLTTPNNSTDGALAGVKLAMGDAV